MNPIHQSVLNRSNKDKFILVLNLPKRVREAFKAYNNPDLSIEPLQVSVFGSVVPDINVPPISVPYSGQVYNTSSHTRPNYPPLTVNFVVDNKFINYHSMWLWLNLLNGWDTSTYGAPDFAFNPPTPKIGNITEYQTNFSILAYDEYNQITSEFIYYNAFITGLGGINYSYRETGFIESTVTFQYSKLNINNIFLSFT
jgi:hypothetical protein